MAKLEPVAFKEYIDEVIQKAVTDIKNSVETITIIGEHTETVSVKVSEKELFKILYGLFGIYVSDSFRPFIKDDALYITEDVSYHGSSIYKDVLVTTDATKVRAFSLIKELETLNEQRKQHE